MISEENRFIKKLEFYLDQEFNQYSKNRILGYLKEYIDAIPEQNPIIIYQEKIKEVIKEVEVEPKNFYAYKPFVTKTELMDNAKDLCAVYDITIEEFLDSTKIGRAHV